MGPEATEEINGLTGCDRIRKEKHLELLEAVNRFDYTYELISELVLRLKDEQVPVCPDEQVNKVRDPSFMEVLDNAPAMLEDKRVRLQNKIEELATMLF